MIGIGNVLTLFSKIDSSEELAEKLRFLGEWFLESSHILNVKVLSFSDRPREQQEGICYSLPKRAISRLPKTNRVIDAYSPLSSLLLLDNSWLESSIYYPFLSSSNELGAAVVVQSEHINSFLQDWEQELALISSKFQDILDAQRLQNHVNEMGKMIDPETLAQAERTQSLLESLNLPMYITDMKGKFTYVNQTFLDLYGYSSLKDLNGNIFFADQQSRANEITLLAQTGRLNGYDITIRDGWGNVLAARDSVLFIGSNILGVLYDVTEFVQLNEELQEALQIQELLNDKLLSSSMVLHKTQTAAIKSLARLAEYRDHETGGHLQRICEYSGALAGEIVKQQPFSFKISDQYVQDMFVSSMLHDIGKVGVPDNILLKQGRLDKREWDVMKKHTLWGWSILNQADNELGEQSFLTLASKIALHHHEKYNGSGYPYALAGEDIPLSARIESIADVYDALTSKRPYKEPWSHEQTMEEIKKGRGTHFDPVLTDLTLQLESRFKSIREQFPE
ncbi:MAG: HD domain-containing phosphohydrolase [Spirochaetia bacterium]